MVSGAMWTTQIGCSQTEACLDENGDQTLCDDVAPDLGADMSADASPSSMDMRPSREDADMLDPVLPDGGTDMKDMTPSCEPRSMEAACNGVCGQQPDGCGAMYDCGMPLTQEQACAGACGMQSDGCGAMIECEPCACENGQPLEPRCGVCQLGRSTCDGDTFSCDVYTIPGLDAATDCDASIVHVNARSMAQTPDGSRAAPFTNLAEATLAASERSARVILVGGSATDEYSEVLEIKDGISVVGGWDVDWYPDPTRIPIIKPLPGDVPADIFGARAIDVVDRDTLVAHLSIKTPDVLPSTDGPGHHNYGLYARNSSKLILGAMMISPGKGGAGGAGGKGQSGLDGESGHRGAPGSYSDNVLEAPTANCINGCALITPAEGGDGGDNNIVDFTCAVAGNRCNSQQGLLYLGGTGGNGGYQNVSSSTYQDGFNGKPGAGGAHGGVGADAGSVVTSVTPATNGQNGASHANARAAAGEGGHSFIKVSDSYMDVDDRSRGVQGDAGLNGYGGGGGGGAPQSRAVRIDYNSSGMMYSFGGRGESGGGGGAGGCGGLGGLGGFGGGSSVGVFLVSTNITMTDVTVQPGQGGAGGVGGVGGDGGAGGMGGSPRMERCVSTRFVTPTQPCQASNAYNLCKETPVLEHAGKGGNGSRGQDGGYGGGGAGGNSIGLVCAESSVDFSGVTMFLGVGGIGGSSLGELGDSGLSVNDYGCRQ